MDTPNDLRDWLLLHHAPGIGPAACKLLLEQIGPPQILIERLRDDLILPHTGPDTKAYLQHPDEHTLERELAWAQQPGNNIITQGDQAYPPLLRELPDPPLLLYLKGNPQLLCTPQLAMVGSRNPTAIAVETAREFAGHLARAGLGITSGLALGIDAASHWGALKANGTTIAVTGTGADRIYPRQHRELAHRVAEQGTLITEFPLGTTPRPGNFPRRNRIISGLCLGTLVVEASLSSGSLITARLAAEQGREVFAIPGSIHNPLTKGCHQLLRDGAKLVEGINDILDELGPFQACQPAPITAAAASYDDQNLSAQSQQLLEVIGFDPTSVDTLVNRSGLTVEAVSSILLLLELHGHVVSNGGLYTRRTEKVPT